MKKFIRRKSCECQACGGSTPKKKLGHLIVLDGEYVVSLLKIKNLIKLLIWL